MRVKKAAATHRAYGISDASAAKFREEALRFKAKLEVHQPRATASEIKAWRYVMASKIGIHLSSQKTMTKAILEEKSLHSFLTDFLSPESRDVEALVSNITEENIERLQRASDSKPTGPSNQVSGQYIWKAFDDSKRFIKNHLAPVMIGLTEQGLPSGTDERELLMNLRVKVLLDAMLRWVEDSEGNKPLTIASAYGTGVSFAEASNVVKAPLDQREALVRKLCERKAYYPPFYAPFCYFIDEEVFLLEVGKRGAKRGYSRREQRQQESATHAEKAASQNSMDKASQLIGLTREARIDVCLSNALKERCMQQDALEKQLERAKARLARVRGILKGNAFDIDSDEEEAVSTVEGRQTLEKEKVDLKNEAKCLDAALQQILRKPLPSRLDISKQHQTLAETSAPLPEQPQKKAKRATESATPTLSQDEQECLTESPRIVSRQSDASRDSVASLETLENVSTQV
eukprot:scaffold7343_cov230-Pinguiococcus_pyrenoidosus.AAC.4